MPGIMPTLMGLADTRPSVRRPNLDAAVKERLDDDTTERLTFSLNQRDRVIGSQDPTIYVIWEGASKEAVHGFVLYWGQRAIHFVADCGIMGTNNPTTHKREEAIEWTIISIGTRSWRSDLRPFHFEDPDERRVACELAVKALSVFPWTYYDSMVTHTSARLSEGLRRFLYGSLH